MGARGCYRRQPFGNRRLLARARVRCSVLASRFALAAQDLNLQLNLLRMHREQMFAIDSGGSTFNRRGGSILLRR